MNAIVTSMPEKLPAEVRSLLDELLPLPSGVEFFEEQFTVASLGRSLIVGIGLAVLAVLLIIFGGWYLFKGSAGVRRPGNYDFLPLITGLVVLLTSMLMLGSIRGRWKTLRRQQRGESTRYGVFLMNDVLVWNSWFDTTVVPRSSFKSLTASTIAIEINGETKSYSLPATIVGQESSVMLDAVQHWARK